VAKVFVSYASKDRERAAQLYRWLVAAGHEVFLAHDLRDGIVGGEQWRKAFIWCTTEAAIAQSWGSRLIPIRDEPRVVHPLLNEIHYVDWARDSVGARAALTEALLRVDAAGGFGWPDGQSPFPGLQPFGVKQNWVFRPKRRNEGTR
jgi:hypothetical protein